MATSAPATRATPKLRVSPAPADGTTLAVGASVLARAPHHAGWYAGTVVGPAPESSPAAAPKREDATDDEPPPKVSSSNGGPKAASKKRKTPASAAAEGASSAGAAAPSGSTATTPTSATNDAVPRSWRVVFVDGTLADVATTDVRPWSRPEERGWHKRRKLLERSRALRVDATSAQRAVEQLDPETREPVARWPTARRAQEALPWIADPADVVACCRAQLAQAGGFRWRFAEPKPRVDAADVDELLGLDAGIVIQQTNPKRAPSKSHDLYEKYKKATTVREMLALGGRRADISYDIAHGWIKFRDPELARRFEKSASAGGGGARSSSSSGPPPRGGGGGGAAKKESGGSVDDGAILEEDDEDDGDDEGPPDATGGGSGRDDDDDDSDEAAATGDVATEARPGGGSSRAVRL